MKPGETVFVDTGAWVALAIEGDEFHARARSQWETLERLGARLKTSVPIVLETFTYLQRVGSTALANQWRQSLEAVERFEVLDFPAAQLPAAYRFIENKRFHKLGLVDATSFVLMQRHKIRTAFAFDTHFSVAGFRYVV